MSRELDQQVAEAIGWKDRTELPPFSDSVEWSDRARDRYVDRTGRFISRWNRPDALCRDIVHDHRIVVNPTSSYDVYAGMVDPT